MFGINGVEALFVVLWLVGIACAVADHQRGHRRAVLIAVAVVVPVLGSLLAVAVFAAHYRGGAHHVDPPVTR
jgi:multisubunit Na+/H+ antiporter MnhG subunit